MPTVTDEAMNPFHRLLAWLLPLLRFVYERVLRQAWFDQIAPQLWVGGAPLYERDYRLLVERGIGAVLDLRCEGCDDLELYEREGIVYLRLPVLDAFPPPLQVIGEGTEFIEQRIREGRTVLVHCAKGRGRAATLVAAHLMKHRGMSFAEAAAVLKAKRPLTSLQRRHRRRLEAWAGRPESPRTAAPGEEERSPGPPPAS